MDHPLPRLSRRLVLLAAALGGCSTAPAGPAGRGSSAGGGPAPGPFTVGPAPSGLAAVRLEGVPHVRQRPDFCGEACLEMAAARLGSPLDQDDAFLYSGVDPSLGRGAWTAELVEAAKRMGFRVGPVWHPVDPGSPARDLDAHFAAMHADLVRGVPSIACMRWSDDPQPEHFRLIVGWDPAADAIIFHEPAEDGGAYRTMPRATFLSRWPLRVDAHRWTAIRLALDPPSSGLAGRPPRPPGPSYADLSQHVQALRPRLPRGFHALVERPFVVIGNAAPADVADDATGTVRFAVERLERDFFRTAPARVLEVWLFADAVSYEEGVRRLTGEAPGTPYGFYASRRGALYMNIATGGGTLVHEIVHPYVEADLPEAPAWVNEGLGSLFEQSADRAGQIWGLPNWRLDGLKAAIRQKRLPPFERLVASSEADFYEDAAGTNYAQARYLMLWLQERGALVPFVHALRVALPSDPTGDRTLRGALGEPDLRAFQPRWEEWVLDLRFS